MAGKKDRARRDQAGVGPDPQTARRHGLVAMHELDGYTIADGEPDIRGWDVRTLSGHEIGEIHDLIVDRERGEVVMIDVEMRDGGVHAEVPIRAVQLDREQKAVIVDSGDVDARINQRPRDRMRAAERSADVREARADDSRTVTHARREPDFDAERVARERTAAEGEEVVVERTPVVEEVVVRRRPASEE